MPEISLIEASKIRVKNSAACNIKFDVWSSNNMVQTVSSKEMMIDKSDTIDLTKLVGIEHLYAYYKTIGAPFFIVPHVDAIGGNHCFGNKYVIYGIRVRLS